MHLALFFFQKIERIEMLDEAELLQQLMEHYCLTVAVKLTSDLGWFHTKLCEKILSDLYPPALGCSIVLPFSIFVMRTKFSDRILDADYEFDIIF